MSSEIPNPPLSGRSLTFLVELVRQFILLERPLVELFWIDQSSSDLLKMDVDITKLFIKNVLSNKFGYCTWI